MASISPASTDITVLKHLTILRLDVNIWSARKKLTPADFGTLDLPPEKLASLGSKKVCNPEDLRIFSTLIQEDVERNMRAGTRHQKISSIASGIALVRGRMTNSKSSADMRSHKVRSCVPGSPASTVDMVACRRFVFSPKPAWFKPSLRRWRRRASPICLGVRAIWSMTELQSFRHYIRSCV